MTEDIVTDRLELVPFGAAPRPTTGPDVADRVLDLLREIGIERPRVVATLDGTGSADVDTLDVDLTGVEVRSDDDLHDVEEWDPPAVRHREPARLRRLRVEAHPVVVMDVPVDVTVLLEDLGFWWVEGTDGRLGLEAAGPTGERPVTGFLQVAAPQEPVVAALRQQLADGLAEAGLRLTALDVTLTSDGPRAASVRAFARLRKGLLSASATATASASLDDALVLSVGDVRLTSANPLVAGLLLAVRNRIDEVANQRIDLAAQLPDGVRIADVRLDVGDDLRVSARLV
ncbi:hypothetical protein [Oerskovia flava]|uniref:hypothetical protein n=1 Tax=Oerskovia flava TaxID=2986422 RepID=UPI00223F01A0|nr:hypothetical protein [Oerskovia sp. JB1-3-2]